MSAMNVLVGALLAVMVVVTSVQSHSYHLGSCPTVEPVANFDMTKFLGKWYVIQKTSTGSRCLINNYAQGSGERNYTLEQISEHFLLSLTSVDHQYRYAGLLYVPDPNSPAKMTVRFPLSVAGSASYTVISTDYNNYAGVFTCQKLAFAHRQSATILSRTPTLEKAMVDKVRSRLSSFNVDPFDLSIINQTACNLNTTDGYDININPNTFTAGSVAGVVRTAGEKIGDGIEYVASGATKLYNKLSKDTNNRDREEINDAHDVKNDAEWLP